MDINTSLNTITLPPLPPFPLPPLPRIADAELARIAVTHVSTHQGTRRALALDGDMVEDYEKFEHVGDSLLGAIVTTLLHELFPQLPPGPATILKSLLVSNSTLAQLCTRYRVDKKLIASANALYTTRMQVKVRASVFEAYIAAVYFDYLTSAVPGAYLEDTGDADDASSQALSEYYTGADAGSDSAADLPSSDTEVPNDVTEVETATKVGGTAVTDDPMDDSQPQSQTSNASATSHKWTCAADLPSSPPVHSGLTPTPSRETTPSHTGWTLSQGCQSQSHTGWTESQSSRVESQSYVSSQAQSLAASQAQPRYPGMPRLPSRVHRTRGQAYDYLSAWLRPLMEPLAHFAFDVMRSDVAAVAAISAVDEHGEPMSDAATVGAPSCLNGWAMTKTGKMPTYAAEPAGLRWRVSCKVTGVDGVEYGAEAVRDSKRAAMAVAAWMVCKQLGLDMGE